METSSCNSASGTDTERASAARHISVLQGGQIGQGSAAALSKQYYSWFNVKELPVEVTG